MRQKMILILLDPEGEYAALMGNYLQEQKNIPWEVHTYTDSNSLLEEHLENIGMLVSAESGFLEEFKELGAKRIVILNESGIVKWGQYRNIQKYQAADVVFQELLEIFMEISDIPLPGLKNNSNTKFFGFYSPIHRCCQTTFAMTMAQVLAQQHAVLYLNFEHYCGYAELTGNASRKDLSDLIYFLVAEKDKFALRMQTMIQHVGNVDYIPPMKSGQNLLTITTKEWLGLVQKLAEIGEYEYVILDLSESMQGLFELLRCCEKIFTVVRGERVSRNKMLSYEQLLTAYGFEDVWKRTSKCTLPVLSRMPDTLEEYNRSELANYVKEQLGETGREVEEWTMRS